MRRNGTPGAYGKNRRPNAPTPHAPKCNRRTSGTWCNHACDPCSAEMARRAQVNNLRQTADLGRMMRQAPRQAAS